MNTEQMAWQTVEQTFYQR